MNKCIILILASLILFTSCDKQNVKKQPSEKIVKTDSTKTKIVFLGTGSPNATPERKGPSLAIIVNKQAYLVDCGTGVCRQAAAAFKKGIEALKVAKLNKVFITHLHSDHILGFADLLMTPWILGREEPLQVWGPKGTEHLAYNIKNAYKEDINIRLSGLQPISKEGYKTKVTEYSSGLIYQDENIDVYAYKVDHGDWDEAYAFQFITPDKVITVSGDCKPCEGIYEASLGCDILVHEVYSYIGFLTRKPEWQTYHKASHTSTLELAELANKIKPNILVLTHILNWGASPENLVKEIQQEYSGKVICSEDLMIIE